MTRETDRRYFRLVLGCYPISQEHWLVRQELRANGLKEHQMCSVGSRRAIDALDSQCAVNGSGVDILPKHMRYGRRQVRELEVHVSSPSLFDLLWTPSQHQDETFTAWMTPAQSGVIWRGLCEDSVLLMVSADSAQQQIKSSQIQLCHAPTVVQAYNFAV